MKPAPGAPAVLETSKVPEHNLRDFGWQQNTDGLWTHPLYARTQFTLRAALSDYSLEVSRAKK
jgi:hypothetical protein